MHSSDTYAQARRELVETVRRKGISDARVLAALGRVWRHRFVLPELVHQAYADEALALIEGQTISQPYTVAYQTEWLSVGAGDRVLEIGTGSGYQAAVLAELGCEVWSIERHQRLHQRAAAVLHDLGYRVHLRVGDGTLGWPEAAPFDAILVTAGGEEVPPALIGQLAGPQPGRRGGRLVIPLGQRDEQIMTRFTRGEGGKLQRDDGAVFRFVPLVSDTGPGT